MRGFSFSKASTVILDPPFSARLKARWWVVRCEFQTPELFLKNSSAFMMLMRSVDEGFCRLGAENLSL